MTDIEATIHVDRPVGRVFAFVSSPQNAARWQPMFTSGEIVGGGPIRPGSRLRYVRRDGHAVDFRVVALEPNRELALTEFESPRVVQSYRFEPEGAGTRLTCRCSMPQGGMPAPVRWLLGAALSGPMRSAMAGALLKLKQALEESDAAAVPSPVAASVRDLMAGGSSPAGAPSVSAGPKSAAMPEGSDAGERFATLFLVAANLVPIAGVLWSGWDVASVVLLYWAENLIAGFYNVLRMATASGPVAVKLFMIPFFVFHYGMFCTVHGALLVGLFHLESTLHVTGLGAAALLGAIARMPGMAWPLAALFVSHGVSFVEHHFVLGERRAPAASFMGRPYARMVVLHVAIIFGGFAVMTLGSSVGLLVVLVGLKLAIDVATHLRSHRGIAPPAPLAASAR